MEPACPVSGPLPQRKILFASAHSIVDFSNGASVATLDVLQGLGTAGFDCQAFCTSRLDFQQEVCLEQIVGDLREPYQVRPSICGGECADLLFMRRRRVPITVMKLESSRHKQQRPEEVRNVLGFFGKFLDTYASDVMITYGGEPTTHGKPGEPTGRQTVRGRPRRRPCRTWIPQRRHSRSTVWNDRRFCRTSSPKRGDRPFAEAAARTRTDPKSAAPPTVARHSQWTSSAPGCIATISPRNPSHLCYGRVVQPENVRTTRRSCRRRL